MQDKFGPRVLAAIAYYGATILLILAAVMVFFLRPPKHFEIL
jgi:hypothetical protein